MTTPAGSPERQADVGNLLSIIAMVCSFVGVIIGPIPVGIGAIAFATAGKLRGESLSTAAIGVAVLGGIIRLAMGIIFGFDSV